MNKRNLSLIVWTLFLATGLSLALVITLTAPRIARADPAILYAAPTAQNSGDCSSWVNACTLQTALTNAVSSDEIWVMQGVHKPGIARSDTFTLKNGVALYGGFAGTETSLDQRDWMANTTVLSGDIDGNDVTDPNGVVTDTANIVGNNIEHLVTGSGTDGTAMLDGFVVTAGQADVYGGGMYNLASSPTLANVIFSGNSAIFNAGGMFNSGSSPTLTNVTFSNNSAYHGSGMHNGNSSSPTLTNVLFSGNHSDHYGGGMTNYDHSNPALTNVTFSGNSASYGGGMDNYASSPTLTNVTFSGNSADYGGGLHNHGNSSPVLHNVIMWGDSAPSGPEIYNNSSTPTISYSDVQGCGGSGAGWQSVCGTDGGGNLDADPLFGNSAGGNLRLVLTSPVIDAGNNAAVPISVTTDLDGNPRFVDVPTVPDTGSGTMPIVDMGAYEAQVYTILVNQIGQGDVTWLPDQPAYGYLDTVVLTVTAEIGWAFTGWSGDVVSSDNPLTLIITRSITLTANFTEANNPPIFTSTPITEAVQGLLYTYNINATDPDLGHGDAISITAPTLPSWLTLTDYGSGTAVLSGTPTSADVGEYNVLLLVTDPVALYDEQMFTITVAYQVYLPLLMNDLP